MKERVKYIKIYVRGKLAKYNKDYIIDNGIIRFKKFQYRPDVMIMYEVDWKPIKNNEKR
jgi:hypothetical protein